MRESVSTTSCNIQVSLSITSGRQLHPWNVLIGLFTGVTRLGVVNIA